MVALFDSDVDHGPKIGRNGHVYVIGLLLVVYTFFYPLLVILLHKSTDFSLPLRRNGNSLTALLHVES